MSTEPHPARRHAFRPTVCRALVMMGLTGWALSAGALGCQRSDQASVQPEKLASSSPSQSADSPPSSDAGADGKQAAAEASAGGRAGGPLLPLAAGSPEPGAAAKATAKPSATAKTSAGASGGPLVPYASGKAPSPKAPKAAPEPFSADPDPPAGTAQAAPPPKALPPPELTLLGKGRPPRKELRLGAKPGHSEQMRMAMQMAIAMEMDGKKAPSSKLPPMLMDMTLKVAEVTDRGLRYTFVLSDTKVPATAGIPAKLIQVLEKALATLRGMKGHAVVTRRGITEEAKIAMPGKANAQTQQIVQGMEQALQQISAPLPEEPVGVGAKWQLVTPMHQNGVSLTQKATYELKKMTADGIVLEVTLEQSAPKQKVASPMGVTVDLLSLTSSGRGGMTVDLDRLAPITSEVTLSSTVTMGLPEGKTMKMSSQMAIGINPPKK